MFLSSNEKINKYVNILPKNSMSAEFWTGKYICSKIQENLLSPPWNQEQIICCISVFQFCDCNSKYLIFTSFFKLHSSNIGF